MRARRAVGMLLCLLAGLVLLAWMAGRIISDRWLWSQWLLWLPGLTLTPAFFILGLGLVLTKAKRRAVLVTCCAAVIGPMSEAVDLWRPHTDSTQRIRPLRLLHWTAGPSVRDPEVLLRTIERANADIVVTQGVYAAARGGTLADWGVTSGPLRCAEFIVLSKYPVTRCRSLARINGIQLVSLDLNVDGQPVHLLLVDLPSDPARSRWTVAQQTRELIESRVERTPDLVLGDFNMSQLSTSLRMIMPQWQLVWPDGGQGWGGTWPRTKPLWRIDHVLVPPDAPLPRIETFDPGAGRHRAQIIEWSLPK